MVQVQDKVVGLKSAEQASLRYIVYALSWFAHFADISRPAPTGLEGEGVLQDAVRGAFIFFDEFFIEPLFLFNILMQCLLLICRPNNILPRPQPLHHRYSP